MIELLGLWMGAEEAESGLGKSLPNGIIMGLILRVGQGEGQR
jgi:hypothetical protein